jgi:hypothetical protein
MSGSKPFKPFDPLLGAGHAIPYRPCWNLLTGSPLASILLQQIAFRWQRHGRKPFYKYAAPCDSTRLGESWQEELGFSLVQFRAGAAASPPASNATGRTTRWHPIWWCIGPSPTIGPSVRRMSRCCSPDWRMRWCPRSRHRRAAATCFIAARCRCLSPL